RLGIKPLYFFENDQRIIFSSEIRALLKSDLIERKLDPVGLVDYLRYQTVHGPRTIIKDVRQLPAGHFKELSDEGVSVRQYWDITKVRKDYGLNSTESWLNKSKEILHSSVEMRMRADVPFGAFLSGGIDSSAIVGLMAERSTQAVQTFNVAFEENEFSEAPFAKIIANKFNTNHTEILLKVDQFKELIPDALRSMDHPSGDGPNTYVVSKATKEAGITMALSGLGGDELFAGYDIFKRSASLISKRWLSSFAPQLRGFAGTMYHALKRNVASEKIAEILREDYLELPYIYPHSRSLFADHRISEMLQQKGLPKNAVQTSLLELLDYKEGAGAYPFLSQVSICFERSGSTQVPNYT
ncbi:MAG: 7-cyano-7-deazaguanine synthase, partial [Flavobacteriales bacterium]|nr:7-cyano-7-deazaguanine synthase [Flavobacteriales bacterium]